jgi:hypothetical protein
LLRPPVRPTPAHDLLSSALTAMCGAKVHDGIATKGELEVGCDAYYDAIDAAVSREFPDRWAEWQVPSQLLLS